jgi:hypothetical protein
MKCMIITYLLILALYQHYTVETCDVINSLTALSTEVSLREFKLSCGQLLA